MGACFREVRPPPDPALLCLPCTPLTCAFPHPAFHPNPATLNVPSSSPGLRNWCMRRTCMEISRSCSGFMWSSTMKSRSKRESSESGRPMFSVGFFWRLYWKV